MGCFSKVVLFVLNFIIFGAAVAVVALASIIIHNNAIYGSLLLQQGIFSIPIVVLIIALIICLIGFLGCCGALNESSCMLKTYAFIVSLLLIAEITLAILIVVYPEQVKDIVKDQLKQTFKDYGHVGSQDPVHMKTIDLMESEFKCCGVDGYKDWANPDWPYGADGNVTKGCCREMTDDCFKNMNTQPEAVASKFIYTRGCFEALVERLKGKFIGVTVAYVIIAVVQLVAIICACGLSKKTGYSYT